MGDPLREAAQEYENLDNDSVLQPFSTLEQSVLLVLDQYLSFM